jgi:hypothetical protein
MRRTALALVMFSLVFVGRTLAQSRDSLSTARVFAHANPIEIFYDRFKDSTRVVGSCRLVERAAKDQVYFAPDTAGITIAVFHSGGVVRETPPIIRVTVNRFTLGRRVRDEMFLVAQEGYLLGEDSLRLALGKGERHRSAQGYSELVTYLTSTASLAKFAEVRKLEVRVGIAEYKADGDCGEMIADLLSRLRSGTANRPNIRTP